ncbi:zinc finger FYVE domain-containing protein 9 [Topomyia yanbarensis]|uniref:zinc finger FYVE domain-containing protein 9 n=1 Tax=Topomyia yanbarensis TaxID=2498891 RepID=UPI00273B332A|nr:zinc finger FYVE domain-containing protein 9 [Topomyia yanbarensis]XP_058812561.1 zinc finger FYVE domain-containing protein 9 [Topomyia yanbarensis]
MMDLVDIDKVLDDLELNEDNNYRTAVPVFASGAHAGEATAAATTSIKPSKQPATRSKIIPPPLVPTQENGTGNIAIPGTSNGTDKAKQKTNISTVFSSLNEYVNASTDLSEKLLQQAEIPSIAAACNEKNGDPEIGNSGDNKPLLSPSTSSISTESQLSSSLEAPGLSSASSNSSEPEQNRRRRRSSCSSKSNSSSNNSSHSSSSSTSTSDGEGDDGQRHERLTEGLSLSGGDYILELSDNTTVETSNRDEQESQVAQAKQIGIGEQQDTSAFSYKNSLYSDTLSNDVINLEGISSISSIVAVDLTSAGQAEKPLEEVSLPGADRDNRKEDGVLAKPEVTEEEKTEVKKVVGFESTMDDVSDTELESYLQELEEYDIQQTIAPGLNMISTAVTLEEEPVPVEVKELIEEKDKKDAISIGSHNSIDTRSDESIPESAREENDEDLISQASTLEFNELAAMTAAADGTNIAQTTEADPVLENDVPEFNHDPIDDGSEIRFIDCTDTESAVVREDLPMLEEARAGADSDAAEIEEPDLRCAESGRTPLTRPNSLELPSQVPISCTEKQSSPGHTPPSSLSHGIDSDQGLTLSSTSSDDFAPSIVPPPTASAPPTEASEGLLHPTPVGTGQPTNNRPVAVLSSAQAQLGKVPPFWIPDNSTNFCMQCNQKFSLIKRRHHCRACGQLLCSACCCLKAKLEYLENVEARICIACDIILNQQQQALEEAQYGSQFAVAAGASGTAASSRQPNPNNPMEYCSTVPPFQQANSQPQSPISVMVPVGVLKRAGAPRSGRKEKTVIFSDGIRPGCDLTELDENWDAQPRAAPALPDGDKRKGRVQTPVCENTPPIVTAPPSLIPPEENKLPPVVKQINKTETKHIELENDANLIASLRDGTLTFALQRNFHVLVTIVDLSCCINKTVINFTTRGMHYVGQDEIVILLELGDTKRLPKDIFVHLNDIFCDADRGDTIAELGFSPPKSSNFLGSKYHGGFLYVRPTYQCMQNVIVPDSPYLVGVLIHRWEVPWAKILPLRLMLRLGALYRYYPSPHVSVCERDSVYVEIAQTVINLLADFRHYSYTIPTIRGMVIHIEDRKTSILIPRNRYEQVMQVLSSTNDQILALGGNFSSVADGHLVCIQNTESGCPEAMQYSTQAINIEGQPRKVTGASFLVLNGILKSTSGLLGKCSIVEDGLMVQVPPAKMSTIKEALKNMKDYRIVCGPTEGDDSQKEIVSIEWTENDLNFNIGVVSPIDKKPLNGVPSIRVHRGTDFSNANHIIRWTEVFIIQGDEESNHPGDPVNMSKLSEQVAKSACTALVAFLDLLASNEFLKIGLRIYLDAENVSYEAGSQFNKLGPLYMNALDNELIGTLNRQANSLHLDQQIIVELIFHILDK